MSSDQAEANDLINVQEAAKRLGVTPLFLRWSLDAGLPLIIQGKHGRWSMTLGQPADAPPDSDVQAPQQTPLQPGPSELAKQAATQTDLPYHPVKAPQQVQHRDMEPTPSNSVRADEPAADVPPVTASTPAAPHGNDSAEPPRVEASDPAPAGSPASPSWQPESPTASGRPEAVAASSPDQRDTVRLQGDPRETETTYLRDLLARRDTAIGDKDRIIADLALRLARLSEECVLRLPGAAPTTPPKPATPVPAAENPDLGRRQAEINARHEEAIRSIRDTLILLRNYLSQLDSRDEDDHSLNH